MSDAVPSLRGRRVLVTGGSGFIGTHVVRALVAARADVTIADLRPPPPATDTGVTAIIGDLTAPDAVDAALLPGTDAIVHLAAVTSVLGSLERPAETFQTNVAMTAALLERARSIGTGCLVMASTNAAVGAVDNATPIDERTPLRPLTPYGATKAAAEMLMSASTAAFGVRSVALRLTNVYGTDMALKDSVIARIMRAAVTGATFEVYGDGRQQRDYIYAGDVVAGVLLGLTADIAGPLVIGSGVSTSVLDLLELARRVTGAPIPSAHVPAKQGEMSGVVVDTTRARALGWSPEVALPEGLVRVWASWT